MEHASTNVPGLDRDQQPVNQSVRFTGGYMKLAALLPNTRGLQVLAQVCPSTWTEGFGRVW